MSQTAAEPTEQERVFLERALELAEEGMSSGLGGPFGAVVVRSGAILAEGFNRVTSAHDPTAHAEIVAIRAACEKLGTHDLSGCEIYCTTEPCPMCLGAILWSRLDRVSFSTSRRAAAEAGFDDEHFYGEVSTPFAERQLPTRLLRLPGAAGVLERWAADDDKERY